MKALTMSMLGIFLLTNCNNQASTNDTDKATKNVNKDITIIYLHS